MRGQDVLADDVVRHAPPFFEFGLVGPIADGGNIVDQGVEPDIAHVIGIEGQFDTPGKPGFRTGNAQVAKFLAQESERLIGAEFRLDEARM